MKKLIAIIVITVSVLSCFTACRDDKSFPLEEGHMLMLGQVRFFSEEELDNHYVGWTRDEMIYTWGTPHSSYYGFYGDAWYHDYENGKMICVRYNPADDKVVSIKLEDVKAKKDGEEPILEKGSKLLLEQVKYFSKEELKEYLKGVKVSDLIEMWGAPPTGCPDLDIELSYGKIPQPFSYDTPPGVSYIPRFHQWCYDYENRLIISVTVTNFVDGEDIVADIYLTTGDLQLSTSVQ